MRYHKGVRLLITAGAALSVAALALTGCTSSTGGSEELPTELVDPEEPVTITYSGAAYAAEQVQPILDAFHELHPTITVKYESVPFGDFNTTLANRLGNQDSTLDVYDVDMPRTDAYAARGWLEDITDVFPDLAEQIDPASIEAATVDDRLLAMPYQTSSNFMYFNKKLLSAAGIDFPGQSPDDRMTWEQVVEEAKAAQAAGAKWGLLFDQIDRYYQLEPLAISAGGGPGATGKGNLTPEVNNAGWNKAFSWYGSLFEDGISPRGLTANETPDLFAAGQVAFYVGGPWWSGTWLADKNLDFGVTPFPAFEGGKASTPTGGWSLGINPASKQKVASLIFLKFFGTYKGGYAQYLDALYVPPANLEGASAYWENEGFKDPRMDGAVEILQNELATTATVRVQTVGYVEFEDIMTKTFSDIINGSDVKKALDDANTQLTDAWAKYQS